MVKKSYTEAEMVRTFSLTRLTTVITARMAAWLTVEDPEFTPFEQYIRLIKSSPMPCGIW